MTGTWLGKGNGSASGCGPLSGLHVVGIAGHFYGLDVREGKPRRAISAFASSDEAKTAMELRGEKKEIRNADRA